MPIAIQEPTIAITTAQMSPLVSLESFIGQLLYAHESSKLGRIPMMAVPRRQPAMMPPAAAGGNAVPDAAPTLPQIE